MMGREWGEQERMEETVDLPVAMEPVRPMRSILGEIYSVGVGARLVGVVVEG